jgi:fatty-acyl-CoA synthase
MGRSESSFQSPSRAELSPLSFLRRSASVWADLPAVRSGARSWSYAELAGRVARLTGALAGRIAPGDRVAAILPNVPPLLELHYGVPGAGGVLVPLNYRLSPAEYRYILEHSGTSLVFIDVSLRDKLAGAIDAETIWVDPEGGPDCPYEQLVPAASQPSRDRRQMRMTCSRSITPQAPPGGRRG